MKRVTFLFLTVILALFLTLSAFALTKEDRAWKEDILTLLPLVKRVGDYREVVDLVEVAPALKKDPEIRKAFITFAPPGATPPEWAKEEKIATAEITEKVSRWESEPVSREEEGARRITQEVTIQKEAAPPVRIEVPEKIPVEVKEKPIEAKKKGIISRFFSFSINTLKNPQTPFIYGMCRIKKEDHYWLGKRYYIKGNYSQAISEFEEDLEISPSRKKSEKYLMKSRYKKGRRLYKEQVYRQANREFEKILTMDSEHRKAREYLNKCQAQAGVEVAKEVSIKKEPIPEIKPIEEEIPEKIATAEARRIAQEVAAQRKIQKREAAPLEIIATLPPPRLRQAGAETTEKVSRRESEQVSREEQRVRPTPLPKGARVIHSTDVVSEVRAEMVEGKMKVTITLSGERKYTISDRAQPPSIIIDIPHTINAAFPGRIMVNQGGIRMIEVTQHRATPFDETRVIIRLSRFKEYEITSSNNEIYIEFEE